MAPPPDEKDRPPAGPEPAQRTFAKPAKKTMLGIPGSGLGPVQPAPIKREPTLVGIPSKVASTLGERVGGLDAARAQPGRPHAWLETGAKETSPSVALPNAMEPEAASPGPRVDSAEPSAEQRVPSPSVTAADAYAEVPLLDGLELVEESDATVSAGERYEAGAREDSTRSNPPARPPASPATDRSAFGTIEISLPKPSAEFAPVTAGARVPLDTDADPPTRREHVPDVPTGLARPSKGAPLLAAVPMPLGAMPASGLELDEDAEPAWYSKPTGWIALLLGLALLALGVGFAARSLSRPTTAPTTEAPTAERAAGSRRGVHGASTAAPDLEESPAEEATGTPGAPSAGSASPSPAEVSAGTAAAAGTPTEGASSGAAGGPAPEGAANATATPTGGASTSAPYTLTLPQPSPAVRRMTAKQRERAASALRKPVDRALRVKDASRAEALVKRWLELDPKSGSAADAMARASLLAAQPAAAVAWAIRATDLTPRVSAFHVTHAQALAAAGESAKAKAACKRAQRTAKSAADRANAKACLK